MNTHCQDLARTTLEGAESEIFSGPEAGRRLMEAGFDGYAVDFRRATRIYYRPDGQSVEFKTEPPAVPVAPRFDVGQVKESIRQAQMMVPGYTYRGFCDQVVAAGCAGYLVSLLGKRVLYFGRTGGTHTEYFPGTRPAD